MNKFRFASCITPLGLGLLLSVLMPALPVAAQEAAPPIVGSMPVADWLESIYTADPEAVSTQVIAPILIGPTELPQLASALLAPSVATRWIAAAAIERQTDEIVGLDNAEQSRAWTDGLLALDAALATALPADFMFSTEPPRSLVEAAFETASAVAEADITGPAPALVHAARAEVIRLTGRVLAPLDWMKLEPLYRDAALRRAVLDAWSRVGGAGLLTFFETRTLSSDEAELLDLIPAIATAYPDTCQPILVALARAARNAEVFWACLDILSSKGVLPVDVSMPGPEWKAEESRRYVDLTLRAAHVLVDQGQCDKALPVFGDITERNPSTLSVRAAIEGMARCGHAQLYRAALGYINDPALRTHIVQLFVEHLDDKALAELMGAWEGQAALTQAALLQVFAQRDPDSAAPLLRSGLTSSHASVRYTAALLMGQDPDEEDLWTLVGAPPAWLQQEALRAYLGLAEQRVARGETQEARQQYLALLQGGLPVEVERAAVAGLGRAGDPADKEILDQLTAEQPLREVSERARVMLAGRTEDNQAKVDAIGGLSTRDVPQMELDAVLAGVTEPEARAVLLARSGFLHDGQVAGPLPLPSGMGTSQLHFPILPYPLTGDASFEGVSYPWRALSGCDAGVRFELPRCLTPPPTAVEAPALPQDVPLAPAEDQTEAPAAADECAYLTFDLRLPQLTGVFFFVHHDDGFALWINGQFQRAAEPVESLDGEWHRFPVVLEPGLSQIVLKLPQLRGAWMTGLRITTRDGKPFDLTLQRMPEDKFKPVGVDSEKARSMLDSTL